MQKTNYSAQARDDLLNQVKLSTAKDLQVHLIDLSNRLKAAIKFRLPEDGHLFDLEKVGMDIAGLIKNYCPIFRLPFPEIALEFYSKDGGVGEKACKVVILAKEKEVLGKLNIVLNTIVSQDDLFKSFECSISIDIENKNFLFYPETARTRTLFKEMTPQYSNKDMLVIVGFLAAISCSNSKVMDDQLPDKKLNISRQKKGKTPFYQYKVLTIGGDKSASSGGLGSKHNSPRMHVRRGHIRRLADKTIWVNSMVVGNRKNGIVEKEYRVKK